MPDFCYRGPLMISDLKHVTDDLAVGQEHLFMMIYAQSPIDFCVHLVNQDFNLFKEKLNIKYNNSQETEYR